MRFKVNEELTLAYGAHRQRPPSKKDKTAAVTEGRGYMPEIRNIDCRGGRSPGTAIVQQD